MRVRDGSLEPIAVFCGLIAAAAVPAVFLAMQLSPGRSFDLSIVAGWFGINHLSSCFADDTCRAELAFCIEWFMASLVVLVTHAVLFAFCPQRLANG